jgi:hypothetical protein
MADFFLHPTEQAMFMIKLNESPETAPLSAIPDTTPVEKTRDLGGTGGMTSAKSKQEGVCTCCGKHKSSCECACCGKPKARCEC